MASAMRTAFLHRQSASLPQLANLCCASRVAARSKPLLSRCQRGPAGPNVRALGGSTSAPAPRFLRSRDGHASLQSCGIRSHVLAAAAPPETSAATASPSGSSSSSASLEESEPWQVKILYDGDCPICMREVEFLQERNKKYGTIKFVDISDDDYSAEDNAGVSFEAAMGHIHGIMRDGTVVTGVEAFRAFYDAIGLGWVYAATKLKPVQVMADAAYELWAKYRLPLTGRPGLQAVIDERRRAKEGLKSCEETEPCEVDY